MYRSRQRRKRKRALPSLHDEGAHASLIYQDHGWYWLLLHTVQLLQSILQLHNSRLYWYRGMCYRTEIGVRNPPYPTPPYIIFHGSQYSIVWLSTPCRWSIRPLFIPIYRAFTILYALTTTSKHAAACSGRSAALRPMPLFDRWHEPIIQIPKELLIGRTLVPMVKVVLGDTAE